MKPILPAVLSALLLSACGTLDDKTILINPGDSKDKVLGIMGVPHDRQFQQQNEAWQYCVSGAGFGYNDHKIIWFFDARVTGITSYRTSRSGCQGATKTINWEEAPDLIIENRQR
ncbi:hypothetical protein [Ferrimonas balearica]|uniref:hypothetical protein n=1 Tax=Ferrimonas balearica TaxID=44012 RepID=UPI001C95CB88|nr:hypothetical protein [Ferrimonas balearica]MBY6225445.1 hypothetical protein [Ferrimonas balearica]